MVNLETAIVVRSMDNLSWQTENLPPVTDPVVILVVGHDNCLFEKDWPTSLKKVTRLFRGKV